MIYSENGLALTKHFEGLSLHAYQDQGGVWTIGYGHTGPDVVEGILITAVHAEDLLRNDVMSAENCVNRALKVAITQNQFDALVDFAFNLGIGNFLGSTLLRKVNTEDFLAAAGEIPRWNHVNGNVSDGLTRRRQAEKDLFEGKPWQ